MAQRPATEEELVYQYAQTLLPAEALWKQIGHIPLTLKLKHIGSNLLVFH